MANDWYYVDKGESNGPISQQQFDEMRSSGAIQPDTLVWRDGMGDWVASRTITADAGPGPTPVTPAFGTDAPMGVPSDPSRSDASTFMGALKDGFARYVDFGTRSNRPQYWWWFLWSMILGFISGFIDGILGAEEFGVFNLITSLVLFLPSLAVAIRRLHDIGRSGWWYLLVLLPVIGWIILLVFFCTKSEQQPNKWGPVPR